MKLTYHNSLSYCVNEQKPCISWAQRYFQDCLCNIRDEISFGFGLISLVCWGVAEIPQIVTNFKTKSSHGVSLLFLCNWIAGDIFNLVGCILEPATLPTQLYTAVLYTATTVVLVIQSLYYDYFLRCKKRRDKEPDQKDEGDMKEPLRPREPPSKDSAIPIPNGTHRSSSTSRSESYYYTSARSLAGSKTPPMRSYLKPIKSGPSALGLNHDSSDDDGDDVAPSVEAKTRRVSKPKPIPRSAGYAAFLATSMNMPGESTALMTQIYVGFTSRKLLQEHGSESVTGQVLGWCMAVVYMGGRVPQIWLNIKRGNVEGLSPLMFIFALAANSTYVASILVRSVAWDRIKANLPWLLDAVVCVLLDFFIILQFVYYRYFRRREDQYGDYVEAEK